jgi:hypothetical protein
MKVTWRNREIFEADQSAAKLIKLEGNYKLAYAVSKNNRVIGNEVQDLRAAMQMTAAKYESVADYEEEKRIILSDNALSSEVKLKKLEKLDEKYPEAKHAKETQSRLNNELLAQTVELELHAIKPDWLPKKFEIGVLGPWVDVIEED